MPRDERDFRKERDEYEQRLCLAAPTFVERYEPNALLKFVGDRLRVARALGVKASPGPILSKIAKVDREYTGSLLDVLSVNPDGELGSWIRVFLIAMWEVDQEAAFERAEQFIASGNATLARAAAGLLSTQSAELSGQQKHLFERLVQNQDETVRVEALRNVYWAAEANSEFIGGLLPSIEMDEGGHIAHEIGELFNKHHVPVTKLPVDTIRAVVAKMKDIPNLDDHGTEEFLAEAMLVEPVIVVEMLLSRVAKKEDGSDGRAIPFNFHADSSMLAERDDYESLVRILRDALLPRSIWMSHHVPILFAGIAKVRHLKTLAVLEEWLMCDDVEKICAAAHLLSHVDDDFVFNQVEWVVGVLNHAWAVSEKAYQHVCSSFATAGIVKVRSGSHGQPFAQDVAMHSKAQEATGRLEPHSPAWRFYQGIATQGVTEIERKRIMDEDEEDEYLD